MIPFLFTLGFPVDSNLLNIKPQFDKCLVLSDTACFSLLFQSIGNLYCVLEVIEDTLPMCVSCPKACSPLRVAF